MNIRKNVDYSEMYAALDQIMAVQMSQMELYCEIGKAVCQQREKGAAVAAAAYLRKQYPGVQGFSPRNLRRMRDYYNWMTKLPWALGCAAAAQLILIPMIYTICGIFHGLSHKEPWRVPLVGRVNLIQTK